MGILITGGAGFIGSHFVCYSLEKASEHDIVVLAGYGEKFYSLSLHLKKR